MTLCKPPPESLCKSPRKSQLNSLVKSLPKSLPKAVALTCSLAAVTALGIGYWIPAKAEVAQWLLERAWRATRSGQIDARPWPWADTSPIARLAIPSLDASWIVLSGASGRNLAFAPSHMDGSAVPGERGVTVIAGHRDTHFARLADLHRGSELVIEDAHGDVSRYRVVRTEIVDATRSRLRLDSAKPMLVLTTCYPFDALTAGGPLRFLVTAEALRLKPDRHPPGDSNTPTPDPRRAARTASRAQARPLVR